LISVIARDVNCAAGRWNKRHSWSVALTAAWIQQRRYQYPLCESPAIARWLERKSRR
jgi:hypothetical protein